MLKSLLISIFFIFAMSFAQAEDPKAIAEKHVKDAIAYAKANGIETAIKEINKGKFKDGEVYVTIYDTDGKCLAHPTKPARVGLVNLNDKDPSGKMFIKERIELAKTKGSGWQTYKFQNPESKKLENKEAYNELFDGKYIFTAGAYTAAK